MNQPGAVASGASFVVTPRWRQTLEPLIRVRSAGGRGYACRFPSRCTPAPLRSRSRVSRLIAERARSSLALASQLDPTITRQAQAAFTERMQSALLYAAVAVTLAALAVTALLHHHTDPAES
jgi:hypothetical protein